MIKVFFPLFINVTFQSLKNKWLRISSGIVGNFWRIPWFFEKQSALSVLSALDIKVHTVLLLTIEPFQNYCFSLDVTLIPFVFIWPSPRSMRMQISWVKDMPIHSKNKIVYVVVKPCNIYRMRGKPYNNYRIWKGLKTFSISFQWKTTDTFIWNRH